MSGSYAYVAAQLSDSLVVVDVSNPASPVIRGSVVSSSIMDGVRARGLWCFARADGLGRRASVRTVHHARVRGATASAGALSRSHLLALMCCSHTGWFRRRERLVRLRDGAGVQVAGGDRHQQPCVSSDPGQRGVIVPYESCA